MTEGTGRIIRRDGITGKEKHVIKWHRERAVPGTTLCGVYIKPGLVNVAPNLLELQLEGLCITCFDLPAVSNLLGVELKGEYYFRMSTTRKAQVPKWHIADHGEGSSLRRGKHKAVCRLILSNLEGTLKFRFTPPPYNTMCKKCTHPKRGYDAPEETN